jgi:elongation factor P
VEQFGNVRRGAVIKIDNELFAVMKTEFRNPGNWRAILHLTLKNLRTGTITDRRVRPQDKVDVAFVDQREAQYLYSDGVHHHFMFTDNYEREAFADELLGDDVLYLTADSRVQVKLHDGKPIVVELPSSVRHKVTETEPGLRGATAQAQYKPAVTETGLKIKVPSFIEIGEVVEIDTRTGEYLGRANR